VKISAFFALGTLMFAAAVCRAEIGTGDARDEVLRQLGKPTSIAKRGGHEIFLYPKGGRIELVDGRVVDVKGPLPTAIVSAADPLAGASAADGKTVASPLHAQPPPAKQSLAHPTVTTSEDYNPAIAANELAKHVEKMDTAWGTALPKQERHSPLDSLPLFLTGLLIRFAFTIVALKLAFKYWEMDAFWTGILLISGIDMTLHAAFELLGPASDGFTTLFAIENGIPGVVMIYTIHRFCFNKRIHNAVLTAAAVKVVATLLYIFAGVAVLNIVYS
jgi:hypothetical protein